MKRSAATAIALALTIFGCSVDATRAFDAPVDERRDWRGVALHVSPSFVPAQIDHAVHAAENWKVATAGAVDLAVVVTDDPGPITMLPYALVDAQGMHTAMGGGRSLIQIVPRLAIDPVQSVAVMAHELGHAFGLRHTVDGLMNGSGMRAPTWCIDAAALAAFCAINTCPAEAHATCAP